MPPPGLVGGKKAGRCGLPEGRMRLGVCAPFALMKQPSLATNSLPSTDLKPKRGCLAKGMLGKHKCPRQQPCSGVRSISSQEVQDSMHQLWGVCWEEGGKNHQRFQQFPPAPSMLPSLYPVSGTSLSHCSHYSSILHLYHYCFIPSSLKRAEVELQASAHCVGPKWTK